MDYLALVSWLCSLIPGNLEIRDDNVTHPVPFNVVGIQQMIFHDRLIIAVAITPHDQAEGKNASGGIKKGSKVIVVRLVCL